MVIQIFYEDCINNTNVSLNSVQKMWIMGKCTQMNIFQWILLTQSCMRKSLLIWSPSSMTWSPDFSFHCVALATLCRISFIWVSGKMDFAPELLANHFRFALKNCSLGELHFQARSPSSFCHLDSTFCSSVTFHFAPLKTADQSSDFIQCHEILRPEGSGKGKLLKWWLFNLQQRVKSWLSLFWVTEIQFWSYRHQESEVEMKEIEKKSSKVQVTGLGYQVPQWTQFMLFKDVCILSRLRSYFFC